MDYTNVWKFPFQSTHPAWGGTSVFSRYNNNDFSFQSTHPAWGGTTLCFFRGKSGNNFNPPTPHGVGQFGKRRGDCSFSISIHPPRMGWDYFAAIPAACIIVFQSTHPAWGGTPVKYRWGLCPRISIHPPRMGWDQSGFGN